ncbi:MAG: dUTP diphosphatase [Thermoleophilia bacterium]|nr:dUTP diphosphatase [Thermoleophilia bacterium]
MSDPTPGGLPVRRLRPEAAVPTRAHPGDAGMDLIAIDRVTLEPGGRAAVPTGIAIAVPENHAGLVLPRSGLARRHGVTVANAPGLIDAGYRGEVQVLLVNLGGTAYTVEAGDRVAQLVISPVAMPMPEAVEELPPGPDDREVGGFGSSGR